MGDFAGDLEMLPAPEMHSQEQYEEAAMQAARAYGQREAMLLGMMQKESGGVHPRERAKVRNPKSGAIGPMQLLPTTAKYVGVQDPENPLQNIYGAAQYLKILAQWLEGKKQFKNHPDKDALLLAAYNTGRGNVLKWKGVPPFKETRDYIAKVKAFMEQREKK